MIQKEFPFLKLHEFLVFLSKLNWSLTQKLLNPLIARTGWVDLVDDEPIFLYACHFLFFSIVYNTKWLKNFQLVFLFLSSCDLAKMKT